MKATELKELLQHVLDAAVDDARDLLHRAETARESLDAGKGGLSGFYVTMMRASHQSFEGSLRTLDRIDRSSLDKRPEK
ncbi:MAG: hypothetical protein ACK5LJ_09200 [Paracoccus sp. (in: a-proteobacteria)]